MDEQQRFEVMDATATVRAMAAAARAAGRQDWAEWMARILEAGATEARGARVEWAGLAAPVEVGP